MRYGYVCTNFNNAHFTVAAVETLNRNGIPPDVIVVVDNQSAAADVEILRTLATTHPTVTLVLNDENVGYFRGLNIGIAKARELDSELDCLVVGNNDLEFPADFGNLLAGALPDLAGYPVISPNVVTMDGMPQNPHVVSGISRTRELVYDLYYSNYQIAKLIQFGARLTHRFTDRTDEQAHDVAQFIYQGHGSCYILTRRFFELFDALWAPTFLAGEEYFLTRQLSDKGERIYYDPRIKLRHHCNGSIQYIPARKFWGLAREAHRVYRRYVKVWHKQGG